MKKWCSFGFILLIIIPVLSQETETRLTIQDFLKMNQVSNIRISPDGSWITYVYGEKEQWDGSRNNNIWLMSIDGSQKLQLTRSEKSDWGPQWSPDGSRIAFISTRSGTPQVYVIPVDGGEAVQVTFSDRGVQRYAWMNPARIAYISTESRDSTLVAAEENAGGGYVVGSQFSTSALWIQSTVHKEDRKKITNGNDYIGNFAASSNGKYFALVTADDSDLYKQFSSSRIIVIDRDGQTKFTFHEAESIGHPAFSPDNRRVAFVGTTVGFSAQNALFVTDLKKQTTKNITGKFDPTIYDVQWLDKKTLSFLTLRRSYTGVYRVPAKGGEIRPLLAPHFVFYSYALHLKSRQMFFYGTHGHHPSSIYSHLLEEPPEKAKILFSPNAWILEKELAASRVIRYMSFDGTEIEAVLTLPPRYDDQNKYGLLVLPHGGPDGSDLDYFNQFGQLFSQEGLIVLRANFRGSIGFGSDFYKANRGKLGDIDYKDIMAGVDYLIDKGMVDSTKMVIGGWSYGGYMTNWTIGQSNRFKAAVSVAGISHTVSNYGEGDINHSDVARWEYMGVPVLNMENYTRASPLYHLSECTTPTLIMHGEEDGRVPVGQAWELYRALKDVGTKVQMVLYPDAGHGIGAPKQYADVITRWVNWYNRYLLNPSEKIEK